MIFRESDLSERDFDYELWVWCEFKHKLVIPYFKFCVCLYTLQMTHKNIAIS
jgi:hypothetical protein